MSSFFGSLFSKQPEGDRPRKRCTDCWYSQYQGKTCYLNDAPREIMNIFDADFPCTGYTKTQPTFDGTTYGAVMDSNIKLDALISKPTFNVVTPSDVVLIASDSLVTTVSTSYVKLKEFAIQLRGKYRCIFDYCLSGITSTYAIYARIYKNGVAYGTEKSENGGVWRTWQEDLIFESGDTCELWGKSSTGADRVCNVRNFRLCGALSGVPAIENTV
jgi:hypothetical protein